MTVNPGPHLALLLLGGFRSMVESAQAELTAKGYPDVRPVHDFAIRSIEAGAASASDLARQLGVSKQAAAKTIAVLEERGYLASGPDPDDGRRRRLTVTSRGKAMRRTGEAVFDELRRGWVERIGEKRLGELEAALNDLGIEAPSRFDAPGWFAGSTR